MYRRDDASLTVPDRAISEPFQGCPWRWATMVQMRRMVVLGTDTDEVVIEFEVAKEWTIRTVLPFKEWMRGAEAESGGFFPSAFNKEKP